VIHIALGSALLALTLGLGELGAKDRAPDRRLLIAIYLLLALLLFHGWSAFSGALALYPHLMFLNGPLMFLLTPLTRRFFQSALHAQTGGADRTPRLRWFDFLPFTLATLLMTPFFFQSGEAKLALMSALQTGRATPLEASPAILFGIGLLWQAYQFGAALFAVRRSLTAASLRREPSVRVFVGFVAAALIICLGASITLFSPRVDLMRYSVVVTALLLPAFHILGRRYPRFFEQLSAEVSKARYEYSRLKGLDLDELKLRIERLMIDEELFTEEDLSLESLAARLELTPHQLSEFFNARLGANFAAYVNGFRIQRACELLRSEPTRSILSIAYDVGFGAKSTFNLAFQRHTGLSPSEYRRQAGPIV
jgi:AraC-like DNA-binding protein